jgi:putative oxidoreductase
MFDQLSEYSETGFWILQAVVGLVFIVHGLSKVKSPAGIASAYGAPAFVGLLHGLVEVAGGLMLIFKFHPQTASLVLGLIMLGAIYFKVFKWKTKFMVMNTTGWEFDLVLLAACIAILLR